MIKDIRGSIEQQTGKEGYKGFTYQYSAFGVEKFPMNLNDIHGFAGYVRDRETDSYYANARAYLTQIHRFMSKDSLRVDSLNRYLYVVNNPVNLVDLSGMMYISSSYSLDAIIKTNNENYKKKLVRLGYLPMMYVMNGEIDDVTKNSIIKFQQDNNLKNTGKFDIITKQTIDEMIKWKTYGEAVQIEYPDVIQNDEKNGYKCSNSETGDLSIEDIDFSNIHDKDRKTIKKYIWNYLIKEINLDENHAAAVMGNMAVESNFNPYNAQDFAYEGEYNADYITNYDVKDNIGWGLLQWTYYIRKQGLLDYTKKIGVDVGNIQAQLEYFKLEVTTGAPENYSLKLAEFNKINNLNEMITYFCTNIEQAGVPHLDRRINAAEKILEEFGGGKYDE